MTLKASSVPVRISKIADRYLVFDADDVAFIRRNHNICSVLVGTTPQNPTQNVFLSLPLELLPEEASLLIEKKVGCLVDEILYHRLSLGSPHKSCRQAYIAILKDRRSKAQKLLADDQAKKVAIEQARRIRDTKTPSFPTHASMTETPSVMKTSSQDRSLTPHQGSDVRLLTVTPTTSEGVEVPLTETVLATPRPSARPLHQHLQSRGYFMTPGLRFGADYSVYPGDPLRYHAHFLATNYKWDEKVPMLDVVGSGRLGTSVKKGFLFGGEVPDLKGRTNQVRTFCVEWAGM
ncbi:tRNA intron endonuclease [Colletotrichum truncatum]|uniref:tRNA intron endonuclease n=1 Tax=Colletotrichum truncatum TaxID=5467 RepID=A0ACC3YPF2_COLTU